MSKTLLCGNQKLSVIFKADTCVFIFIVQTGGWKETS